MKKAILILAIILFSFKTNEEKKYKFEFTETQLQIIWNAIDNSSAPHDQIKQIQAIIQGQYKSQLDTTKKK